MGHSDDGTDTPVFYVYFIPFTARTIVAIPDPDHSRYKRKRKRKKVHVIAFYLEYYVLAKEK
jgi:hypothetical protein